LAVVVAFVVASGFGVVVLAAARFFLAGIVGAAAAVDGSYDVCRSGRPTVGDTATGRKSLSFALATR
jgi:hypothetical protein